MIVGLVTFAIVVLAGAAGAPRAQAAASTAVTLTAAQQDPDAAGSPFPDLSVTVSQTTDLTSQGVRLTYSGGAPSTVPNQQAGGANFLQVMQCWGDLKGADGQLVLDQNGQPQPDRETCQYGATGTAGASRTSLKAGPEYVSPQDKSFFLAGDGFAVPAQVSIPFKAVNGKVLERIADGQLVSNADLDTNEFFTKYTTDEVPWAGFGASGSGTTTFEVQSNAQAPGLGCGNPVTAADGTVTGQPCWLVVVPRGTHDWGESQNVRSGLLWETWQHRLAVKLQFKPLGVRCAIGAAETSLAGSELLANAIASWQPKLCGTAGGSIYNLIVTDEADQAVIANDKTKKALALTIRAKASDGTADNLTYAPVAVSGLTIAFAIDHRSDPLNPVPADIVGLDQQPFTQLRLTPRLVAKLLTNSYTNSLPVYSAKTHLGANPDDITKDPDFLAVNDPVWKYQRINTPALADALVPLGRSDAAWQVWQYVLSDPEAVSFLSGVPDKWGMIVNPYSATDAVKNPTGTAATYPKDSFPKADPAESDWIKDPGGNSVVNVVTWRPYASDLQTAGYWALRGDGRVLGQWDPVATPPKFASGSRAMPGSQAVIGVTDTAAAARYTLFTAALRNPAGEYVTPTVTSMGAAASVMTAVAGQPQVMALDYASTAVKSAAGAYPLTVPIYAATNPAGGDAASRAAYAAFIKYAVGAGQVPGTDDGQLPDGYAPLPASWVTDAKKAADTIAAGPIPTPTPTATPTPIPTPIPTPSPTSLTSLTAASVPVSRAAGSPAVATAVPDTRSTAPVASSTSPTASGQASGQASGPVVGRATPQDPDIGALRAAVPVGAAGGLLAAVGVPLVSRIRRRP